MTVKNNSDQRLAGSVALIESEYCTVLHTHDGRQRHPIPDKTRRSHSAVSKQTNKRNNIPQIRNKWFRATGLDEDRRMRKGGRVGGSFIRCGAGMVTGLSDSNGANRANMNQVEYIHGQDTYRVHVPTLRIITEGILLLKKDISMQNHSPADLPPKQP